MKLIKTYFPIIISMLFFATYSILLTSVYNNQTSYIKTSFVLGFGLIILIFFIEWIYIMIHAAKNKELKDKALWIILIYLFNVFITPYYTLKYIAKENKVKEHMIIYILCSILSIIVGISLSNNITDKITINLQSDNNEIIVSMNGYYEEYETEVFDIYAIDNTRYITFGLEVFDKEDNLLADEILDKRKDFIYDIRYNVNFLSEESYEINNKIITSKYFSGEDEIGSKFVYQISTIEFSNSEYIIDVLQIVPKEDLSKLKKELKSNLINIELTS